MTISSLLCQTSQSRRNFRKIQQTETSILRLLLTS